jgi:SAM-dependent methyltransferase
MPQDMECLGGDMEARFPFEDGRFDVVVSVEGIEHVSDRQGALNEYRRVTRKGGRLILTTPNMLSLRARLSYALCGFRTLNSWLDEYSGIQGRSDDGERVYHGHAFLVDYNQLRYSLHQAGFRVTRVLPMHDSRSSHLLKWVMYPWVWASTRRACFLGKRKFEHYRKEGRVPPDAPNPADEIYRHLMSRELLYGRVLGLEAVAV